MQITIFTNEKIRSSTYQIYVASIKFIESKLDSKEHEYEYGGAKYEKNPPPGKPLSVERNKHNKWIFVSFGLYCDSFSQYLSRVFVPEFLVPLQYKRHVITISDG